MKQATISMKRAWPFVYAAVLLGMIGWLNFITADDRHYSELAESFLEGKLFFVSRPPAGWGDTAPFELGTVMDINHTFSTVANETLGFVSMSSFLTGEKQREKMKSRLVLTLSRERRRNISEQRDAW
jgi:hypothetical protein